MTGEGTIAQVLSGEARWAVSCARNEDVLPTLADKSVAHVITDPPYEAEAHTLQRRGNRDMRAASDGGGREVAVEPLSFAPISDEQRGWAGKEVARLSRRWAIVFCQVEAAVKWRDDLVAGGHRARRIGVWVKPDGMPQFSGDRPAMGYESIVYTHAAGRSTWNGGGKSSVLTFNKHDERSGHETQKPLPLMLELVSLFTDPDDLVLDPFCGSGTTGVACLRLGRRFIGVELNEKYAAISVERLRAEENGQSLRESRAGQLPMFGVEP